MKKLKVFVVDSLKDREPAYLLVANVDLVVIRYSLGCSYNMM